MLCSLRRFHPGLLLAALLASMLMSRAQDAGSLELPKLEEALSSISRDSSTARQRLAVRRVIRDAQAAIGKHGNKPSRWALLEFQFRAQQRLIAIDDDSKHRESLIEISRELIKAPDEFAAQRLEADLLLSQVEQARKGMGVEERSGALREFVARYVATPAGAKALRTAIVMGLEMGDTRLVNDLRKVTAKHYSSDLEMIAFLRDHLGGQVFGVPFVGHYQRSDGRRAMFPMDGLGHSSMVLFWSKDNENIIQYLTDMAAAQKLDLENIDGRLEIVSVNLDGLPDAGESIIRGVGADWQCLSLPGGRESAIYKAYVRRDPLNLRVAPTGQAAMVMAGSTRKPPPQKMELLKQQIKEAKPSLPEDLKRYTESFRRAIIRGWSNDLYSTQLCALMVGDFLVFDPEGFNAAMPPELKAAAKGGKVTPLKRKQACVPEESLMAIQGCLIAPPQRYHASIAEIRAGYQKMIELCRKAIAKHPEAPDLWIVRNRLIIGLMGLWKIDFKLEHFEAAAAQAKAAMEDGYPEGCDVIARFCLARQAFRDPASNRSAVLDAYVADQGGESAHGPVLASACLLALDIADEARFQGFRELILRNQLEHPMMWIFTGFLLDRYHDYWLFQVPFTAGWSFGRRQRYEMQQGVVDEALRRLDVELPTFDGKTLRIPEDLESEYTAIFFAQPGPWKGRERDDPKPPSPGSLLRNFPRYVVERPDLDMAVAILGEADEAAIRENIDVRGLQEQPEVSLLKLPEGPRHLLVQRLALQSDREAAILIDKQGHILSVRSGISFNEVESAFRNTIEGLDEKAVMAELEKGEVEKAKQLIMALAPPYDPEAKDERGRQLPVPKYGVAHLRARGHVYMALKQWDKALTDAEAVVEKLLAAAGGMSLRTDELDEAEALRDELKGKVK